MNRTPVAREALDMTHAQRTGEIVRLALDFGATVPEVTRMVRLPLVALVHYLASHGEVPTACRIADLISEFRTV